jgi:hypothetical protein
MESVGLESLPTCFRATDSENILVAVCKTLIRLTDLQDRATDRHCYWRRSAVSKRTMLRVDTKVGLLMNNRLSALAMFSNQLSAIPTASHFINQPVNLDPREIPAATSGISQRYPTGALGLIPGRSQDPSGIALGLNFVSPLDSGISQETSILSRLSLLS